VGGRDRTGWLGRQDSSLYITNSARLGLPLPFGAKSGGNRAPDFQQARARSVLSARHDSSEGSGTQIPDAAVRVLPPNVKTAQNGAYRGISQIWLCLRVRNLAMEAPFLLPVSKGLCWCLVF
jgi:hypothetical protein